MSYQIQIKQRGGKWATWCEGDTLDEVLKEWDRMPSIRRRARIRNSDGPVIKKNDER